MIFEAPLILLLAPVLAIAVGGGAWVARRRRVRGARAWSRELGLRAARDGRWGPVLLGAAALMAGIALAGPRWGRASVVTQARGLDLVMSVDISRSMLAEDASPNRLQHAADQATRLVDDLAGDRIGLLAFAGQSYILTPLTTDGGALRLYLDALAPDLASQGGTSLAATLQQGAELLAAVPNETADRVLLVFTDGETHDSLDESLAAARRLKSAGVHLVLVGEGGIVPARIPLRDSTGALSGYQLDQDRRVIQTSRDDAVLRQVADAGDGTLVSAELPDQAGAVRDLLARLKRSPSAEARTEDLVPRAWIAALIALLLLLIQSFSRRTAALVSLAGLCVAGRGAWAQRPAPGQRTLARGDAPRAAQEFLGSASHLTGAARDTAFYNAGTAALRAGRLDVARGALEQASRSLDPALRYRALYNLGVVDLAAASADSAKRDQMLEDAVARLRDALLLQPQSDRAKWNLELAMRRRPPPTSGGGGGKGGGGAPPPPPAPTPSPPPPNPGLSRDQAEQVLNSMERQEEKTRASQVTRNESNASAVVKDW